MLEQSCESPAKEVRKHADSQLLAHILAVLAVIALLIIQANAELALPNLMSEIVDVGIQQGGIVSPIPTTIQADALSDLELFMTNEQKSLVEAAYGPANESGIRTYQAVLLI